MWPYISGETLHLPRGSPQAASNPAETRTSSGSYWNVRIKFVNKDTKGSIHNYGRVPKETEVDYLICYGKNDIEEGHRIFRISHSRTTPRNINVESFSSAASDKVVVSVRFAREKCSRIVAMHGDVKYPRVIVEHILQKFPRLYETSKSSFIYIKIKKSEDSI